METRNYPTYPDLAGKVAVGHGWFARHRSSYLSTAGPKRREGDGQRSR
jgi:hypothetical protein